MVKAPVFQKNQGYISISFHWCDILDVLGLPTNFHQEIADGANGKMKYIDQVTIRKGQKKTYLCNICMIPLSR